MSEKSRTYNSILNSVWGIAASLVTTVLNFVLRVVLVKQLGAEINGLHNLFQSIINVMALMEMGLNTAMIIHLYAPLKEKNIELTRGIISFYRRIYRILALSFLVVGIAVDLFFMEKLVTSSISLHKVQYFFILFVLTFVFGYLTNYRRCILFAEQKNRVSIITTSATELLFRSCQIGLLFIYPNYIIFLVLMILERVCNNSICNFYVKKNHPYLCDLSNATLTTGKKKAIFATVKPLFVNQMANTVQLSSRSILISILLGNVRIVGYFGNYQLILNVIQLIYSQFGGSFTASFGNLSVEQDKGHMRNVFFKSSFVMNWMAAICSAGFLCCADPFIHIVFGPDFVLSRFSTYILGLNLIIYLLNIPIISIQNALGLHRLDAMQMVIQAILAIALGYVFGKLWGMEGIFLGLLIPLVVFTFIRKGIVIGKASLDIKPVDYISFILKEFFKVLLTVVIAVSICQLVGHGSILGELIFNIFISLFVGILLPFLLSLKSPYLIEISKMINNMIKKCK